MSQKKILRIDVLRSRIVGEIEIDGASHNVKPMTFAAHQTLEGADDRSSIAAMRDAVRLVVPTLSDEQLASLDADIGKAILTLAGAGIEAVEALFPNAVSPEGPTSPG